MIKQQFEHKRNKRSSFHWSTAHISDGLDSHEVNFQSLPTITTALGQPLWNHVSANVADESTALTIRTSRAF